MYDRLGEQVREIVPPSEANVEYENGMVMNADALSEEYLNNEIIKSYVDDPHCSIIVFENPPYADSSSSTFVDGEGKRVKTNKREKYITKQFKEKALPILNEKLGASRETVNLFIWSAFEYYMRQPTDSVIVFSPVKYFKNIHLCPNKKMKRGFAFNREHFGEASKAVVSCVWWLNEQTTPVESWELEAYNITGGKVVREQGCPTLTVEKTYKRLAEFNDKRTMDGDTYDGIICSAKGREVPYAKVKTQKATYNDNIMGYVVANGYGFNPQSKNILRCADKTGYEQSFGFYLRSDNYREKLPIWVAKLFPTKAWYEIDVFNTSSDGGEQYIKDGDFLRACFLYACLSKENRCLSFHGSDGRDYRNELCFDEGSIAKKDLDEMNLSDDDAELISLWDTVLSEAKKTANYNKDLQYGLYQINEDLNTEHKEKIGKKTKSVPDYVELNSAIDALEDKLKEYYQKHITPKLLKYKLVK